MGLRGEMFSTRVARENRTYFFNVKENRKGEMFLTIVESKHSADGTFERHQVMVFQEDFPDFADGLEKVVSFMKKERYKRATGRGRSSARDDGEREGDGEKAARSSDANHDHEPTRDPERTRDPESPREQGSDEGASAEKPRKKSGKVHTPKPRPKS